MNGESVEQAALRRTRENDWQGRAERAASAILDECGVVFAPRDTVVSLLAIAWLQGVNLGAHETLSVAEVTFENLRAAL